MKNRRLLYMMLAGVIAVGPVTAYLMTQHETEADSVERRHEQFIVYELPAVLVNLHNTRGTRYLRVAMSLEISDEAVAEELDKLAPKIMDYLINTLASIDLPEVDSQSGREQLKRRLVNDINDMLVTGRALNVYFTEFVVQ